MVRWILGLLRQRNVDWRRIIFRYYFVDVLGMYVPVTAEVIVNNNNNEKQKRINLKGILVGNGVLKNDDNFFDLWNREYMIKRNFYDIVTQNVMHNSCSKSPQSASCQRALEVQAIVMKDLNPYDVYGYCYGDSSID